MPVRQYTQHATPKNLSELSEERDWCRGPIVRESPDKTSFVVKCTEVYRPSKKYELAQRKSDPYLSPHGMFRRMAAGNYVQALEFVKEFGPLILRGYVEDVSHRSSILVRVELADFWKAHRHFICVSKLHESLVANDTKALRNAIEEYVSQGHRLPLWAAESLSDPAAARYFAREVIEKEISDHTEDISFAWTWESGKFVRSCRFESLLSVIWDQLATDLAGISWRICPHCGKLFYPPRKDRFYCTTRQQTIASKQEYEEYRARERRKRASRKEKSK